MFQGRHIQVPHDPVQGAPVEVLTILIYIFLVFFIGVHGVCVLSLSRNSQDGAGLCGPGVGKVREDGECIFFLA